ncbi:hypothetical protein JXI42_08670 [bacterium]|nr:hypothetical protein [bacterium]
MITREVPGSWGWIQNTIVIARLLYPAEAISPRLLSDNTRSTWELGLDSYAYGIAAIQKRK